MATAVYLEHYLDGELFSVSNLSFNVVTVDGNALYCLIRYERESCMCKWCCVYKVDEIGNQRSPASPPDSYYAAECPDI